MNRFTQANTPILFYTLGQKVHAEFFFIVVTIIIMCVSVSIISNFEFILLLFSPVYICSFVEFYFLLSGFSFFPKHEGHFSIYVLNGSKPASNKIYLIVNKY